MIHVGCSRFSNCDEREKGSFDESIMLMQSSDLSLVWRCFSAAHLIRQRVDSRLLSGLLTADLLLMHCSVTSPHHQKDCVHSAAGKDVL